jgi:TPR repeat protein
MCGKEMFEALQQLLSRSDEGRVIQGAQFILGACYQDGNGVAKDDAEAVRLFRLAADQGHAASQINLGVCYRDGRGVVQDDVDSARWCRVAADQGHATAQYYVGVNYLYGTGVVRDIAEGIRWLRLSAGQGCVKAQDLSATLQACFDPH